MLVIRHQQVSVQNIHHENERKQERAIVIIVPLPPPRPPPLPPPRPPPRPPLPPPPLFFHDDN